MTHNRSSCASKWSYSAGNWIVGVSYLGEVGLEINAAETVFKGKGRRWNPEGFQTLVTYRNRSQKSSKENTGRYRSQRVSEGRTN